MEICNAFQSFSIGALVLTNTRPRDRVIYRILTAYAKPYESTISNKYARSAEPVVVADHLEARLSRKTKLPTNKYINNAYEYVGHV